MKRELTRHKRPPLPKSNQKEVEKVGNGPSREDNYEEGREWGGEGGGV